MTLSPKYRQPIELIEYESKQLSPEHLPDSVGHYLWQNFDQQRRIVSVHFPSPRTNNHWSLTASGWVGHIPLPSDFNLYLYPKVPLTNLFRLWAVAYELFEPELLARLTAVSTFPDFFEQLADLLAWGVLRRAQTGFYQTYETRQERLPYVRGRLHLPSWQPQNGTIESIYSAQTTDVAENQILAFTLEMILKNGRLSPPIQQQVRRAYATVRQVATPIPFSAIDCYGRSYNALNRDYAPLHALCRFFLEQSGPSHHLGEHQMLPFLMDMPRLFEQFVARWLQQNLPAPWQLRLQESLFIGDDSQIRFDIDLVLYDGDGRATAVIDTKYKRQQKPAAADLHQIIAYAKARSTPHAVLIYPLPLAQPLDFHLDDIHLRSLSFPLDGDLNSAGTELLHKLLLISSPT